MSEPAAAVTEAPKPKFIVEYQHTDEAGNPLLDSQGRPVRTNLVADTAEELIEKQRKQNIEVTRALYRARNAKPVAKEPEVVPKQLSVEEERQAAADLQDPTKARAAARKLVGIDQVEEELKIAKQKQDAADVAAAQFSFLNNHVNDFFRCEANSREIKQYLLDNSLDPRVAANYEIAFEAVSDRLAAKPAPAPRPEEIPPPAPKREADGGLQPGTGSGARPMNKRKGLTKADIKEMRATEKGRQEYRRKMQDPAFVAEVNALFAGH